MQVPSLECVEACLGALLTVWPGESSVCVSQEPMSAALWGGSLSAEVKLDESCVFTLKSLCGVDLALVLAGLRPSQTCL